MVYSILYSMVPPSRTTKVSALLSLSVDCSTMELNDDTSIVHIGVADAADTREGNKVDSDHGRLTELKII